MKKVFLGLLVAGVALAGSAFTNVKTPNTVYITFQTGTGSSATYFYSGSQPSCNASTSPCKLQAVAPYTFPAAPNSISAADLNNASKVQILSRQTQL